MEEEIYVSSLLPVNDHNRNTKEIKKNDWNGVKIQLPLHTETMTKIGAIVYTVWLRPKSKQKHTECAVQQFLPFILNSS